MLTILNELTLAFIVGVCWWLSHVNASGPEPFRRSISLSYSLAGWCKAAAAGLHWVPDFTEVVPVFTILGRFFLGLALTLVAMRLMRLYPEKPAP